MINIFIRNLVIICKKYKIDLQIAVDTFKIKTVRRIEKIFSRKNSDFIQSNSKTKNKDIINDIAED